MFFERLLIFPGSTTSITTSSTSSTTLIALLASSILLLIALAVTMAIVWKRRQAEVVAVSRNELYGTYEVGVEYSMVTDANDYYAPGEDQEERSRATDRKSQYAF